ncbi:MAG: hypothetical protein JWM40_489 [Frankiales bacterium]|nr:hypothetical protein [Frankiales bacterium]
MWRAARAVEEVGRKGRHVKPGSHAQRWRSAVLSTKGPLVAALLACALLVGVGVVALNESTAAITRDAQVRLDSNRAAAVRALTRQASDLIRTMQTYAGEPNVPAALTSPTPATRNAAEADLTVLAHSKGAPAIVVTDLSGRAIAIGPPQPALRGADLSSRDWYIGVKRTGKPYLSSAYPSIAPGAPLVVGIATPVLQGTKRVGYLAILGGLDQVRAVADSARNDDGVTIAVTDQLGQLLTNGEAGQDDLTSAAAVPGIGWTVAASLPKDIALQPQAAFRNSLELTLGAALLLILLFTGVAILATRRRVAEHEVIAVERARLATLFAASPIGILECDAEGTVVKVNEAMSEMVGYDPDELLGLHAPAVLLANQLADVDADMSAVLAGDVDQYSRERLFLAKDGTLIPAHTSVIVVRGHGDQRNVVAFVVDQRKQKRIESALRASEERLTQLALHDELTGLPNRRLLFTRCTEAFDAARLAGIEGTSIAALFIDLDGFKPINDHYGHETGDQVLVEIADDLRACLDPLDTVARVGGDEFVVLVADYLGHEHLLTIAERAANAVRRTVSGGGLDLHVTASVGVASIDLAVEPDARPDQLLSRADAAMYLAKERGPDRREVFRSTLDRDVQLPSPRAELQDPRVSL